MYGLVFANSQINGANLTGVPGTNVTARMSKRQTLSLSSNSLKRSRLELEVTNQELPGPYDPGQGTSRANNEDWGDDPDDEMLFLASQACERAETCDMSAIANQMYDMKPPSTNTKKAVVHVPQGDPNHLKKFVNQSHNQNNNDLTYDDVDRSIRFYENPNNSGNSTSPINSNLNSNFDIDKLRDDDEPFRNYCDTGISNIASNEQMRQILNKLKTLEKDNDKLKEEHNVLMDKCLTKDGEVSILRKQVKNMQTQMSLTKSNHIKNHEMTQIEWNEKFKHLKNEIENYSSSIEFKNLEIINLKEKCKLLESSKIKFTEPQSVALDNSKWMGFTQNLNSSFSKFPSNGINKTTTKEQSIQAENKSRRNQLYPMPKTYYPLLKCVSNSIFHHSATETPIVFNSNKPSQFAEHSKFSYIRKNCLPKTNDSKIIKKRKSFFHDNEKRNIFYEHLKILMSQTNNQLSNDTCMKSAFYVIALAKELLLETLEELNQLENKSTSKTIREMDEKYIELSGKNHDLLIDQDPFTGNCWFPSEQAIDARRVVAVSAILCEHIKLLPSYILGIDEMRMMPKSVDKKENKTPEGEPEVIETNKSRTFLDIIFEICKVITRMGCSFFYTGLLSSICCLLRPCIKNITDAKVKTEIYTIIRELIFLRPHVRVAVDIIRLLDVMVTDENFLKFLCNNLVTGNLKIDSNEGVAVYNEHTCLLQLLCNNIEVWSLNFIDIYHIEAMFSFTNYVLKLHQNGIKKSIPWAKYHEDYQCFCSIRLSRCLCLCLHKSVILYKETIFYLDKNLHRKFNSTLRAGILVLNFSVLNNFEFVLRLCDYESNYFIFLTICNVLIDKLELQDIHKEALLDLSENIIPVVDNLEQSCPDNDPNWEHCFDEFSVLE